MMSPSQTNWPFIINVGNSIIGVTVLAMPFCFKTCGVILSCLMLFFSTWLTVVSCQLLMKAGVTARRRSFSLLAYYTHGATGKLIVEVGMIGLQLGTLIAQVVIIGDLGPAIVSKATGLENTDNLRTGLIVSLCLFVGLPLALLKDVRTLSKTSTLCILFYTFFTCYVVLLSIPNLIKGDWYNKVNFWRKEGFFQCLPIFSFAFGCQTQLFIVYDALAEPSLKRINNIVGSAVHMCTLCYLLVGFFGYIAFCNIEDMSGDIINHFQENTQCDIIKLCFVVSIAVSIPLICFPCRASLFTLLFPHKPKEDVPGSGKIPEFHFKVITVCIISGSMVIGILIPNIEFVLGLNGATMGTLICYIFPALFFLNVMSDSSERKSTGRLVLFLGLTIMIASTYTTLSTQTSVSKVIKSEPIMTEKPPIVDHAKETITDLIKKDDSLINDSKEKPPDTHNYPDGHKPIADKDTIRREPPNPQEPDETMENEFTKAVYKDRGNYDKKESEKDEKQAENDKEKDKKHGDKADELKSGKKEGDQNGDISNKNLHDDEKHVKKDTIDENKLKDDKQAKENIDVADGQKDEKIKEEDKSRKRIEEEKNETEKKEEDKKKEEEGKKKEEVEKKQEEILAKLEHQQVEQEKLIQEQKEILEQLKEHQEKHKGEDVKGDEKLQPLDPHGNAVVGQGQPGDQQQQGQGQQQQIQGQQQQIQGQQQDIPLQPLQFQGQQPFVQGQGQNQLNNIGQGAVNVQNLNIGNQLGVNNQLLGGNNVDMGIKQQAAGNLLDANQQLGGNGFGANQQNALNPLGFQPGGNQIGMNQPLAGDLLGANQQLGGNQQVVGNQMGGNQQFGANQQLNQLVGNQQVPINNVNVRNPEVLNQGLNMAQQGANREINNPDNAQLEFNTPVKDTHVETGNKVIDNGQQKDGANEEVKHRNKRDAEDIDQVVQQENVNIGDPVELKAVDANNNGEIDKSAQKNIVDKVKDDPNGDNIGNIQRDLRQVHITQEQNKKGNEVKYVDHVDEMLGDLKKGINTNVGVARGIIEMEEPVNTNTRR